MHILYFHQHFSTPQGSTSTRSYEMARRLVERGHSVTIICGSERQSVTGISGAFKYGRREGRVDGIRVIELNVGFVFHSIAIALTETYDVVFATATPIATCLSGIFAKLLRRKPFLLEVREVQPVSGKAISISEWVAYRAANRLIGLAPGIVDGIQKRGIPAERITMIPNGCDLALFAAPVSAWRPAEVRDDDIMAVYAGTHGKANGLNAALDAAVELKRRGADHVKLVFIGTGQLKPKLVERAKRENLDNVLFLESVSKVKLAGLMASADIGMQLLANVPAFYYGTSPNKFFDYIAAGIPVLCNYPGWLAEMITLHQCGFAVAPDNPKAFADALVYAANNRPELAAMGPRAQQLGRTAFSRDALAEKFCKWIEATIV